MITKAKKIHKKVVKIDDINKELCADHFLAFELGRPVEVSHYVFERIFMRLLPVFSDVRNNVRKNMQHE